MSKRELDDGYSWVAKADEQKKLVVATLKSVVKGMSLRCEVTMRGADALPGPALEARLFARCDSLAPRAPK